MPPMPPLLTLLPLRRDTLRRHCRALNGCHCSAITLRERYAIITPPPHDAAMFDRLPRHYRRFSLLADIATYADAALCAAAGYMPLRHIDARDVAAARRYMRYKMLLCGAHVDAARERR